MSATYYVYTAAHRWLTTYHYLQSRLMLQIKQCRIPWNVSQSSPLHHFEHGTANTNAISFRTVKMECDVRIRISGDKKRKQNMWHTLYTAFLNMTFYSRRCHFGDLERYVSVCVSMGITHSSDDFQINKTLKIESKTYNDRYTCKSLNSLTFRFRNNPVICEREKSEMLK